MNESNGHINEYTRMNVRLNNCKERKKEKKRNDGRKNSALVQIILFIHSFSHFDHFVVPIGIYSIYTSTHK